MKKKERRLGLERRSGFDRRKSRQFDLSGTDFIENREKFSQERRTTGERREGYTLISKWHGSKIGVEVNL
ncbi:MAG: hypothetical protein JRI91_05560 [Deltaproteobacteria bacterium]|nr:hypothetical protein [Deltaproteobacteria bacterium]MBW2216493.1 hypothetical protein [Deltaproteobacteria bacterium]